MELFIPMYATLSKATDFEFRGSRAYLKGTNVAMPTELTELIGQYIEQGLSIKPLVNFWVNCMLNPNEQARQDFFKYIQEYGILLTDNGYAILYKAVNKGGKGDDFQEYISSARLDIMDRGEDPSDFFVVHFEDEDDYDYVKIGDSLTRDDEGNVRIIGTIASLYVPPQTVSTDKKTLYTPWHSGGEYGNEIYLGEVVEMPREECDPDSAVSCSHGLHVGSYDYVKEFGSGLDTILAILVNPKDIVALPEHDNSKIRTCRYFPYAVIQRERNGDWEELESVYFEEDFMDKEQAEIRSQLDAIANGNYGNDSDERADLDPQEAAELLRRRMKNIHGTQTRDYNS